MGLDDRAAQGQAQSRAAKAPRGGDVSLDELLEESGLLFRGHPNARILNGQHFKMESVERIRSIRKQLTQENFPIFIKGVDQNIKQLFGFSFERK